MSEEEWFEADEKRRISTLHKTAPETIWLQIDPEAPQFDGCEAQTWCEDQINDTDLEYVRADVVAELRRQLSERLAANSPNGWIAELRDQINLLLGALEESRFENPCETNKQKGAYDMARAALDATESTR